MATLVPLCDASHTFLNSPSGDKAFIGVILFLVLTLIPSSLANPLRDGQPKLMVTLDVSLNFLYSPNGSKVIIDAFTHYFMDVCLHPLLHGCSPIQFYCTI